MDASSRRILTTHVGSLIRPERLLPALMAKGTGQPFDATAFEAALREEVETVVARQAEIGIDIVSDGEFGKALSWSLYGLFRLTGFERREIRGAANPFARGADRAMFPEFYADIDRSEKSSTWMDAVCVGPISYSEAGKAEVHRDIANLKAALAQHRGTMGFLPVASTPSVIPDRKNEYYANGDACAEAIGKAMRAEYQAITDSGLYVQLDDARIAVTYDRMVPPATMKDYRRWAARSIEIVNESIKGLPRDRVRYHVCWGSWPGPHVGDVPFRAIADLVMRIKAGAFSLEMANARHEHEWRIWEDRKLPDGVKLIPGVISHQTNVVEHPELVCERIVRLANLVGRDNVIAGSDCGFAQVTYLQRVHPSIQWAKLKALVDGARLATKILWPRKPASSSRTAKTGARTSRKPASPKVKVSARKAKTAAKTRQAKRPASRKVTTDHARR